MAPADIPAAASGTILPTATGVIAASTGPIPTSCIILILIWAWSDPRPKEILDPLVGYSLLFLPDTATYSTPLWNVTMIQLRWPVKRYMYRATRVLHGRI